MKDHLKRLSGKPRRITLKSRRQGGLSGGSELSATAPYGYSLMISESGVSLDAAAIIKGAKARSVELPVGRRERRGAGASIGVHEFFGTCGRPAV